jgi:hypothetical protein
MLKRLCDTTFCQPVLFQNSHLFVTGIEACDSPVVTGLATAPEVSEGLKDPFQGSDLGAAGSFYKASDHKTPGSSGTDAGLTCTSFGWSTVWKSFSSSKPHGGRATEAYLKSHPEESDEIHVIMG